MSLSPGLWAEMLPQPPLVPGVAPTVISGPLHVGEMLKANSGPSQSNLLALDSPSLEHDIALNQPRAKPFPTSVYNSARDEITSSLGRGVRGDVEVLTPRTSKCNFIWK